MQLLPTLSAADTASLSALNARLGGWVEGEYHRTPHRGLGGLTPLDEGVPLEAIDRRELCLHGCISSGVGTAAGGEPVAAYSRRSSCISGAIPPSPAGSGVRLGGSMQRPCRSALACLSRG